MHKERIVNCHDCGVEVVAVQWNQKYCRDCGKKRGTTSVGFKPKLCASCGKEFLPRTSRNNYCSDECLGRNAYYLKCYGITQSEYNSMKEERDNKCDICGGEGFVIGGNKHTEKLCVDHDHETGKVRGLLCHNCNRALGLLKDDIKLFENAINYLNP